MLDRMTSWRDTTTEEAQNDLDSLLNAVLTFAEQALVKYGEFYPYGAGVTTAGEIAMLAADPGLGENPPSDQVLATLYGASKAQAGEWRALAIVAPVSTPDGAGVRVELEHSEQVALLVLLPYTIDPVTKEVTTGELRAGAAEPRIW